MPFCEFGYFSHALGMQTRANILLPETSQPGPYPVMFLLHGLSDDYTIWSRRTSIERYMEGIPMIVVMPDGGRGFYCDAEQGFAYATAIGTELPQLIERWFPTRGPWCSTGLSMGGYGAVRLALDHPERFRSAASHSGALAFGHDDGLRRDDEMVREFSRILGPNPVGGVNDLFALAEKLPVDERPSLRIDCGTEDFLIDHNRSFHAHLERIGYSHDYEEPPGAHTWEYWDLHVRSAIAFHMASLGIERDSTG